MQLVVRYLLVLHVRHAKVVFLKRRMIKVLHPAVPRDVLGPADMPNQIEYPLGPTAANGQLRTF